MVVGTQTDINVILEQDAEQLDEVVVIGYGTTEKTSFTGSATMVNSEQVENIQTANPLAGLEGSVPGLQMTGTSGQPGSSPSINVRGFSSINQSNDPLIIVDGTPFDGQLNAINPKDIESFSVLKDASGTAIYGSRATNGIIMITTKSGKGSQPKINLSARVGVTERAFPEYDRVNASQYYEGMWEGYKNRALSNDATDDEARQLASQNVVAELGNYNAYNVAADQLVGLDGKLNPNAQMLYNDDWQDEMFGTGLRHEYNLSMSGGGEKTDYFLSTGYLNEEGIVDNSGFEKLTARLKVNTDVKPWLRMGANINYGYTESAFMGADGTATSNPFYSTRMMGPIYPVYLRDEKGNYVHDDQGERVYDYGAGEMNGWVRPYAANSNVVATTRLDYNKNRRHNIGARGYVQVSFLNDFKFTSNISTDIFNTSAIENQNKNFGDAASFNGRSTKTGSTAMSYTFNQVLTYQKKIGRHSVSGTVGHEAYKYQYDYLTSTRTGFSVPGMVELGAASSTEYASSYFNEHAIESYFGRAEYNFDNKYFVSGSVRADGTSRFAESSRWGNFWSIGASWRLSEEEFLKDVSWVNELKLRASHGALGNEGVLNVNGSQNYFPWQALYDLGYANNSLSGGYLGNLSNPSLQWEQNISSNIGVDFTLLNRINGTVEYYIRDSKDLIMDKPVAPSLGFDNVISNIGAIRNKGVEISVNADVVQTKDFNWNLGVIWSKNINEIIELESPFIDGNKYLKEGGSIFDFYYVEYAGVDPDNGDALYYQKVKDDQGNLTGERVKTNNYDDALADSREVLGSSMPDFQGSISNTISYKGFDLSILMTFSKGGLIYDATYARLMMPDQGSAMHQDLYDKAWRQPGDVTDVPRIELDENQIARSSSRFLTDASYFGIRNMTLGYNVPVNVVNKMKLGSMRAYVTADNLWYSNERQGLYINPSRGGNTGYGYVPVRTVSFGLDLSF
ncbi:hypothetical protein NH26_14595 [Flammeovirga pacifica]|uniref:TonB-dependent receptor plug domain-containing protein n=1 Tax=Flammeovirga pacifica TaxID=915059 RepID=A0A1S1Z5R3_FLAPC|nr:hypothetical protein NH26_14595 [Flammeovirga pacifica]